MNLTEIKNAGGFVSGEPVKAAVKWKEYTFDVWIKRLSFGDVETLHGSEGQSRFARMIATAILLGEDKEPISYEDALRLDVGLAMKLIEALNVVNNVDQKKVA